MTQEHKIAMQLKKTRPVIAVYGTHTHSFQWYSHIHSEKEKKNKAREPSLYILK